MVGVTDFVPTDGGSSGKVIDEYRAFYIAFLRDIGFVNTQEANTVHDHSKMMAALTPLCGSYMPQRIVALCATFAESVYKLHPFDTRRKIAHYTALAVFIDDLAQNSRGETRKRCLEDLKLFSLRLFDDERYARLHGDRGDLHPVFQELIALLRIDSELNLFFPEVRLQGTLIKCTIDFLDIVLVEQHYEEHPLKYLEDIPTFPRFVRWKSGISELYGTILLMLSTTASSPKAATSEEELLLYSNAYPVIGELIEAFNIMNDIMSFYKEMKEGETHGYLLTYTKVCNITAMEAMRREAERVFQVKDRLLSYVDKNATPQLQKVLRQFFQGYLAWHIGCNKRYKLNEVLGEDWFQGRSYHG